MWWTVVAILCHYYSVRVFFPYLHGETTEESLRAELKALDFKPKDIHMFLWSNNKSRGSAVVTMSDAKQALELVTRHDIEIDGWSVEPKLLLVTTPEQFDYPHYPHWPRFWKRRKKIGVASVDGFALNYEWLNEFVWMVDWLTDCTRSFFLLFRLICQELLPMSPWWKWRRIPWSKWSRPHPRLLWMWIRSQTTERWDSFTILIGITVFSVIRILVSL